MTSKTTALPVKRTAVVTGAAHGIGLTLARTLIREGLNVALLDLDEEALQAAVRREAYGQNRPLPLRTDVTDEADVAAAIKTVVETFGTLDILVNNAGLIFDLRQPIESLSLDAWRRSLEVNATGTFLVCRAAVPHMRHNGYGRIVNVTSALVGTGAPGRVHYVSSKAAVIGLTRALARELGRHGITVNALAPGLVDSGPRARAFVDEEIFTFEEQRRCISSRMLPSDLSSALLFLAAEESRFITGQVVTVDGGVVMG